MKYRTKNFDPLSFLGANVLNSFGFKPKFAVTVVYVKYFI